MVSNIKLKSKNTYQTSDGERVSKSVVDRKIREAKEEKLNSMMLIEGYVFCEVCSKNSSCGEPLDCAHIESVKSCQDNGITEKAWSLDNIKVMCRTCHRKHDKTSIN